MAERGLALITHINAAGLTLAEQAAVQRESRLTLLFFPADKSAMRERCEAKRTKGYFVGVIVYHVKKITSAIAGRADCRFKRYHAARLLSAL